MQLNKQQGFRLGIVDDDAMTLAALRALIDHRLFSTYAISVLWTTRFGNDAVERCVHHTTRPDAMLIDMGMDDIDGATVCLRIRHISESMPILAMTAHSLNHYRTRAQQSGAQALLDKADFAGMERCLINCALGKPYVQEGFSQPTALPYQSHCGVLSAREAEIMNQTIEGYTAREVAIKLGLSEATVKTHVRHVITKLGARNKLHAIRLWSSLSNESENNIQ
ncbi:DNA-binding response regulator [Bifidobacterium goeldii]|uniref:DNA-binding response regulator n=2 Tax=Bifidobacterium goeldii TaxID=2306975 RepID=A0A430FMB6_9BIFI|nr:DNA-binding response regulator [Bifidobacterium goeldii]